MPLPWKGRPPRRWAATWMAAASASTWAPATASAPPSPMARWSSARRWRGTPARRPIRNIISTASTIRCSGPPRTCRAWTPSAAAPRACTSTTRCGWARSTARVPRDLFDSRVRRLFFELQAAWGGIPFEVVNDGEVTALAGSMALGDNAVLGIAMGSSLAAGFVTPQGAITTWLNELAFVPVDYREDAPADEWSGDRGVGVQYFSQQAVGRLLEPAGIDLPPEMPLPAKLEQVQKLMAAGDDRARKIYETIGVWFGYTIAHYADFYEFRNLLVLGRVMTGEGGDLILSGGGAGPRGGVPRGGRAHPFPHPRREGKAARPGHRRRQPARHSSQGDQSCSFIIQRGPLRSRWPGARSRPGAHHAPVHFRAPGRYRDHGLPRHRRVFRPDGQVVHGRGGDQRRRQPAIRHLRRLHRRRDAEGAPRGAAQSGLRGRVRLPDPARLHQLLR